MRVEKTREYGDWIDALKDRVGRARIQVRVDRLIHGNAGQRRDLSGSVSELKQRDIAKAIELAKYFQE